LFNLALRLVRRAPQDLLTFRFVGRIEEKRSDLFYRAQVQAPIAQHLEQDRIRSRRPCHGDAQVGRILRQVQHLGAVAEHRGRRLACKQPASIDLADMRHEIGGDVPRLSGKS